jgi:dTDP-4-amino-4,6-dideoxygalactose transaminase
MNIKFKQTFYDEKEELNVTDALKKGRDYLNCAKRKLAKLYGTDNIFLTANGSLGLDLLLLAYDFPKGSEVILPSFTYPSALNSILRAGLVPVFCDINVNTLVMDINDAKSKISEKTVCVIPTHYGGASCDMDKLKKEFSGIKIIEDAALSIGAKYKNRPLGTLGDAGTVSFHKTKNVSSDEGGAVIVNDESILKKLETVYENGTDRQAFLKDEIPFYSWQNVGMNAKMSNINAAVLCAQLDKMGEIESLQQKVFEAYMKHLLPLSKKHGFILPTIPAYNTNNAHVFYIIFRDGEQKKAVAKHLKNVGIEAVIHYIPLHLSNGWKKLGSFDYKLPATEHVAECMLRLPLHAKMSAADCEIVAGEIDKVL